MRALWRLTCRSLLANEEDVMNLETIDNIGESIAVLVVIITLIAVLYQSRQANLLVKLKTTHAVWLAGAQLLYS